MDAMEKMFVSGMIVSLALISLACGGKTIA